MTQDQWQEVKRIPRLEQAAFWSTLGAEGHPVVLEQSVPGWRQGTDWSINYLREKAGHQVVSLDRGYFDETVPETYPLSQILDAIESGAPLADHEHPYLRNIDVHRDLPELVADVSPRLVYVEPNWMTARFLKRHVPDGLVEFFIGGAGSAFPKLHFDTHGTHAFITQLHGTKHIVAIPPTETAALERIFGHPEKFKLGGDAALYENLNISKTTLRSGDTLFVPNGWWHLTYMTELSISVSSNCVNGSNWDAYVESVTRHNRGLKKQIKLIYYRIIRRLLAASDSAGFGLLYRHYE